MVHDASASLSDSTRSRIRCAAFLSVDGGETFLPPERIASPRSCTVPERNGSGFSGDSFGLSTDSRGRFRLLWSGPREGLLQLHLATIEVSSALPASH